MFCSWTELAEQLNFIFDTSITSHLFCGHNCEIFIKKFQDSLFGELRVSCKGHHTDPPTIAYAETYTHIKNDNNKLGFALSGRGSGQV